jgi:hypothetical protein
VKYTYTFLALLGIVFASHAQQPASEISEGKILDKSKSQRVASPNRTSSRDWVRSHKPQKSAQHKGDKDSSKPAAVVWVDSTGETVGRAVDTQGTVLVTFENELIALQGLTADRNCDSNFVCTFSGGVKWGSFFSIDYTSNDCTGVPYVFSSSNGRPVNGVPIVENGETFIYFYNITQNTVQTIQSFFSGGECLATFGGFRSNVSPVTAVVPASIFGLTPFFLK